MVALKQVAGAQSLFPRVCPSLVGKDFRREWGHSPVNSIISAIASSAAIFYAQFYHLHFTAWVNVNTVLYVGVHVCVF